MDEKTANKRADTKNIVISRECHVSLYEKYKLKRKYGIYIKKKQGNRYLCVPNEYVTSEKGPFGYTIHTITINGKYITQICKGLMITNI